MKYEDLVMGGGGALCWSPCGGDCLRVLFVTGLLDEDVGAKASGALTVRRVY